jgi:hypothetical protein
LDGLVEVRETQGVSGYVVPGILLEYIRTEFDLPKHGGVSDDRASRQHGSVISDYAVEPDP